MQEVVEESTHELAHAFGVGLQKARSSAINASVVLLQITAERRRCCGIHSYVYRSARRFRMMK